VRDIASRLVVGLGLLIAVAVAVGYAFIFLGNATPVGAPLATLPVPAPGEVVAARLDDGRPVYLVGVDEGARVLDARSPVDPGVVPALVAWCDGAQSFLDLTRGGTFGPGGEVMGASAAAGLDVYPTQVRGDEVVVRDGAAPAGTATGETVALDCPMGSAWTAHAPTTGEIFDPSVAADTEPPGWVWLEGRLTATGDEVELCDGLDAACPSGASVVGIDPAKVQVVAGRFLGRIIDHEVRNLVIVPSIPDSGGSS
jgi:hypothetical protein